jgi:hypothetical protein
MIAATVVPAFSGAGVSLPTDLAADPILTPRTAPSRVPRLGVDTPPQVEIARSREHLLAAYRLVYQRYAARGLVQRQPAGIIYSCEFAQGDSRTLVALSPAGEVTATATIVGCPGEDELDDCDETIIPWKKIRSFDPSRRLAGVTCLASTDCQRGMKPAAFFSLARFLFQYARYRDYDGLAISIHPRQLRFYSRICPIVPLGKPYRQPKLCNAPAVACRIDLDSIALSRVAPSVLSWFATPISVIELDRPGIDRNDDAFLTRYAELSTQADFAEDTAELASGS